jgi:type II secretory pathway pseudopilin PulG
MKQKKGFTIIELMVYCSLSLIVLAAIFGTLVYSLKFYRAIDTLINLQRTSVTSLAMVTRDLIATKGTELVVDPDGKGIMFPSYKDNNGKYKFDSDGNTMWQKWICYYVDDKNNFIKKETAISPVTGSPPKPSGINNVEGFINATIARRVVARNIDKFSIISNSLTKNYTITITADDTLNPNKPNKIEIKTELSLP